MLPSLLKRCLSFQVNLLYIDSEKMRPSFPLYIILTKYLRMITYCFICIRRVSLNVHCDQNIFSYSCFIIPSCNLWTILLPMLYSGHAHFNSIMLKYEFRFWNILTDIRNVHNKRPENKQGAVGTHNKHGRRHLFNMFLENFLQLLS